MKFTDKKQIPFIPIQNSIAILVHFKFLREYYTGIKNNMAQTTDCHRLVVDGKQ